MSQPSLNIKTEHIAIWNGRNYVEIVQILVTRNEEMTVRVKGKRLLIKDKASGFYRCISSGEKVEIPKYQSIPVRIDEPIEA